jgi:hypothetical protein
VPFNSLADIKLNVMHKTKESKMCFMIFFNKDIEILLRRLHIIFKELLQIKKPHLKTGCGQKFNKMKKLLFKSN